MSNSKLLSALLLAAPAALLALGCSAEVKTSPSPTQTETASADTGHEEGDGHDHAAHAEDADAGHLADEDGGASPVNLGGASIAGASKPAPEVFTAGSDAKIKETTLPEGHSADDGHDHGPQGAINNPPVLGDAQGPRLVYAIGAETHNFGHLMQGAVSEHTFELSNDGTEDLIIKQVKPTCGCTVAQVKIQDAAGEFIDYTFGDPIKPEARVQFPAKLHTKNKSGHVSSRINIFSNDPRGTIQLGLEAEVEPFFTIAPRFLNFGQISVGDVVEKKAVISTSKGTPVGLSLVEQSLPAGAQCDLTPVNPDAEGRAARWDLSVTLGPELTEGNLARAVNLTSDVEVPGSDPVLDGAASKYGATLTLSAQVVGPFSYNPPYLSMGLVRPGQVATRTVTVECHDESFSFAETMPEIRVVGLQNPGTGADGQMTYRDWEYADRFTPTVRPVEGKNAIEVELRLEGMPDNATGSFRGTLLVDLGHADKKQIQLVITGVCRGGPVK